MFHRVKNSEITFKSKVFTSRFDEKLRYENINRYFLIPCTRELVSPIASHVPQRFFFRYYVPDITTVCFVRVHLDGQVAFRFCLFFVPG